MSFKLSISDNVVLEKSITNISFRDDPPNDFDDMYTYITSTIIVTGKTGAIDNMEQIFKWTSLPATDKTCYKKVTAEVIGSNGQTIRKITFSDAFVVSYNETFLHDSGVGTYELKIRQKVTLPVDLNDLLAAAKAPAAVVPVVGATIPAKAKEALKKVDPKELLKQQLIEKVNKKFGRENFINNMDTANAITAKIKELMEKNPEKKEFYEKYLDMNEYNKLKAKTVSAYNSYATLPKAEYSEDEAKLLRETRNVIKPPDENTVMQRVVCKDGDDDLLNRLINPDPEAEDKYGGIIGGFTAKAGDAARGTTDYDTMREANRLDYVSDGKIPYPEEPTGYYVVRYTPRKDQCSKFQVPFGTKFDPDSTREFGQPFTQNGYTGSENVLVPEYHLPRAAMPNEGALYHVNKDGKEELFAVYDSRKKCFRTIDDVVKGE